MLSMNHFIIKYSDDELYYLKNHEESVKFVENILNNESKIPISINEYDEKGILMEYKINCTTRFHWTKIHHREETHA
jgi:hypothetical protein